MRVLVLNCGSSSVKFRLLDVLRGEGGAPEAGPVAARGAVRGIGGNVVVEWTDGGGTATESRGDVTSHDDAVRLVWSRLVGRGGPRGAVDAVGHRVVHGGERFADSVVFDGEVEAEIEALGDLAPLHNPACLAGIRAARAVVGPAVPMVCVFDTAFHRTLPGEAREYALPVDLARKHGIRRYGFHGIAHAALAAGYSAAARRPLDGSRLITLQLGNGCSAAAIRDGFSIETSMGFTPLEGLVMGTRSGDIDPSVVALLAEREKVSPSEVVRWLNERSGLLGLSGRTNDTRELLRAARDEGDERCRRAIAMFCHRVRKYVGAYLAVLGGADAIVFGGGIGENSPEIRGRICDGMEWCGLLLDKERNEAARGLPIGSAARIGADRSKIAVYVVAEDEETRIALETARCLGYRDG